MIQRASVRGCAALVVLVVAVLAAVPARAVLQPGNVISPNQAFDLTIDLTGNVFANGNGSVVNTKAKLEPFKFTNPLNHPLSLFGGPINLTSIPVSDPLTATHERLGTQMVDYDGLALDLLNGQSADFALDTIFLTTNSTVSLLKSISIDVSGTLTGLRFDQTGSAQFLGGGESSGTFSIAGELTANIDNLLAVVFGLLQVPVEGQTVVLPTALEGTWKLSSPFNNGKLELDGDLALSIPLSLLTNLTTSITDVLSLTISSTIDLAASLALDASFHLEPQFCWCPEPGSIALLGIGLAAVGGVAVHRRRGKLR